MIELKITWVGSHFGVPRFYLLYHTWKKFVTLQAFAGGLIKLIPLPFTLISHFVGVVQNPLD